MSDRRTGTSDRRAGIEGRRRVLATESGVHVGAQHAAPHLGVVAGVMRHLSLRAKKRVRQKILGLIDPFTTLSFRTEQADAFSSRFAPAKRSACAERNLSSSLMATKSKARIVIPSLPAQADEARNLLFS